MNCYFIKGLDYNERQTIIFNPSLNLNEREIVESMSRKLSKQLKDVKGKISFYYDSRLSSAEIVFNISKDLSKYREIDNNCLFMDERLNPKKLNEYLTKNEIQQFGKYKNDAFDLVTEMVFNHSDEDAIVIVTMGDDFFKTCQREDDIHNLFYFGDEFMLDQRYFRFYNFNGLGDIIISANIDEACMIDTLKSKVQLESFVPYQVNLEKPLIEKESGAVEPVYLKYAKQKLEDKQKKLEEPSSMGE